MTAPPAGADAPAAGRPLPRLTLPPARERRLGGAAAALAIHGLILFLVAGPIVFNPTTLAPIEQGAGGEGPAGGGGGGNRGTGGSQERIEYVAVAPPPPAPATSPTLSPVVPPPVEQPPVTPPAPTPPVPQLPTPQVADVSSRPSVPAPMPGVGGGTGNDGTAGSGPGTGGGVGSGIGTGRGSGIGPGTGGGTQANHPPTPTEMFLPPLPTPANVRGFRLIAEFDVDSTGRVLDFTFTETRNRGYNRQLEAVLKQIRFRPGTRPDGTPIRMKAQIEYIL